MGTSVAKTSANSSAADTEGMRRTRAVRDFHSTKLGEDDAPQLLALLRYIAVTEPQVLTSAVEFDSDTFRETCDARFLEGYQTHKLYQGLDGVQWSSSAS